MEVNIQNKLERKRLSLITDVVIFLIFLNVFLFVFKFMATDYALNQNLSLEDIEISNKNYIEISNIKEKYGINVIYGDKSYDVASKVNANIETNEYTVNEELTNMEKALLKYPSSFFVNNNLTVVFVKSFNNSNIALASRNKLNEYKIYISDNGIFEMSFHHEMYHVFEYKMNISGSNTYADWDKFNPAGFEYEQNVDDLDSAYVYSSFYDNADAYFVSRYSKTSEKEDRAEIFSTIMTFKNKPSYLINPSSYLYKKAVYISDVMTKDLKDSSNTSFYWNRF